MSVQVIDLKTGKLKTMPVKYANILVKMKRARWPDQPSAAEVAPVEVAEMQPEEESVEATAELPETPKKRGRKPKVQK